MKEEIPNDMSARTIIFDVIYMGQCGCGFGRKVTRKIILKESQTLEDLHNTIIINSFRWTDEHLYSFYMDCKAFSNNHDMEYTTPGSRPELFGQHPRTADVKLVDLNLKPKQKFLFVYDFGDDHRFTIKVAGFGDVKKGIKYPQIIESKGVAPKQYSEC
jgi:hypothetical protein